VDSNGRRNTRDAIAREIATLPEQLRQSLTWDQERRWLSTPGSGLTRVLRFTSATRTAIAQRSVPKGDAEKQRGTNENTHGLLRQYFPKGPDLSVHGADDLAAVAMTLNTRPRKTLNWKTPAEAFDQALQSVQAGVATTG
jgi:IS30 family transposase